MQSAHKFMRDNKLRKTNNFKKGKLLDHLEALSQYMRIDQKNQAIVVKRSGRISPQPFKFSPSGYSIQL